MCIHVWSISTKKIETPGVAGWGKEEVVGITVSAAAP